MKTKFIIAIIAGVIISGTATYLFDQMYDCLNPPIWMKFPRVYGMDDCLQMYYDGTLPDYTIARESHEKKMFNRTMEKKATLAFNMTLTSHSIDAEKLTVRSGYRTGENQFYMAEAVTENSMRYFLMSSFEKDESPDKIKVELFEIISDKCTHNDILNSRGCPPNTIKEVENEN